MTPPPPPDARSRSSAVDGADLQVRTRELPVIAEDLEFGAVRWFSEEKGYGFIAPDGGGEDVFVRFSSIESEGFRTLADGQRVAFTRTSDARGPRADHVHVI